MRGSSALRAALSRLVRDGIAAVRGFVAITTLWDLEKFYDTINIILLVSAGLERGYPRRAAPDPANLRKTRPP